MKDLTAGMTMNAVLGIIPGYYNSLHASYPDITLEEVKSYVTEMWDSL